MMMMPNQRCLPQPLKNVLLFVATLLLAQPTASGQQGAHAHSDSEAAAEAKFLTGVQQITFEGRRAGEGYFSADGSRMVFQSERDQANPFYQIYVTDLETGDIEKVSPGHGKTTCPWIPPSGDRILFAST
ncbi:MAG: hypothetical protein MI861_21330, partial [Pirellulales bacterium]|nr:hypothetical protein [Pirellulales bacterium]